MDFDDKSVDNKCDMWEWQEDDYDLIQNSSNGMFHCLWNEMNQNEYSLMYMLEEQTPIKDCADFGYEVANNKDYTSKLLEECIDSSQQKRRRMLHFPLDGNETGIAKLQPTSLFLRAKERVNEALDEEPSLSINVEWTSQWNLGVPEGTCALNSEAWDQPSEGWPEGLLDERAIRCATEEKESAAPEPETNCDEAYQQPDDTSDLIRGRRPTTLCRILKGGKSMIGTSTNLTTSVAYPFALIKPCGAEGDLTLKDINQKLHTLRPSRSRHSQQENSSFSYPTSAFSGKPVVVKTKIRTEGGKGSITIMRTKG